MSNGVNPPPVAKYPLESAEKKLMVALMEMMASHNFLGQTNDCAKKIPIMELQEKAGYPVLKLNTAGDREKGRSWCHVCFRRLVLESSCR